MKRGARKGWRWRVSERTANKDLHLLYEPGNWGDILKGLWAILATRTIIEVRGLKIFHHFDPFAGAPTYPLVEASRRRLEGLPLEGLKELQEPYGARGLMASTAVLVRDAAGTSGAQAELKVFDLDPVRKEAWKGEASAQILEAESGEDAIERLRSLVDGPRPGAGVPDLVLVDPYDLFNHPPSPRLEHCPSLDGAPLLLQQGSAGPGAMASLPGPSQGDRQGAPAGLLLPGWTHSRRPFLGPRPP